METINHKLLESIRKDKTSKNVECKNYSDVLMEFVYSKENLFKYINQFLKNMSLLYGLSLMNFI